MLIREVVSGVGNSQSQAFRSLTLVIGVSLVVA